MPLFRYLLEAAYEILYKSQTGCMCNICTARVWTTTFRKWPNDRSLESPDFNVHRFDGLVTI